MDAAGAARDQRDGERLGALLYHGTGAALLDELPRLFGDLSRYAPSAEGVVLSPPPPDLGVSMVFGG